MLSVLFFYLLTINAVGVMIMLADKRCAQKKLWRIPEATLFTAAILGGSVGILLGMRLFHHKTRKPKFYIGIPLILMLQLSLAAILLWSALSAEGSLMVAP